MRRILRDLPFYLDSKIYYLHPGPALVRILPRQIPVRISLGVFLAGAGDFTPATPSFPAILDTGFNGSVAITGFHLREWAGVAPGFLGAEAKTPPNQQPPTVRGFPARAFESRFYIRPNRRREWEADEISPVGIAARIMLVDAPPDKIRLPLLGMAAFDHLGRKLMIDYRRRLIQL